MATTVVPPYGEPDTHFVVHVTVCRVDTKRPLGNSQSNDKTREVTEIANVTFTEKLIGPLLEKAKKAIDLVGE